MKIQSSPIVFSKAYNEIAALKAWGANLRDLEDYMNGGFSRDTIATLLAWHRASGLVASAEKDHARILSEAGNKSGGSKKK